MSRVESPTHLIDFWSLKSLLKSLEIILISMKSNDFKITYAIFVSVGPLASNGNGCENGGEIFFVDLAHGKFILSIDDNFTEITLII